MAQLSTVDNIIIFIILLVIDGFSLFYLFKASLNNPFHGIVKESVILFNALLLMSIYVTFWIIGYVFFFTYALVIEKTSHVYDINTVLFMIIFPTISYSLIWYKTRENTI